MFRFMLLHTWIFAEIIHFNYTLYQKCKSKKPTHSLKLLQFLTLLYIFFVMQEDSFLNILFAKNTLSPGKLISELKAKQKWAHEKVKLLFLSQLSVVQFFVLFFFVVVQKSCVFDVEQLITHLYTNNELCGTFCVCLHLNCTFNLFLNMWIFFSLSLELECDLPFQKTLRRATGLFTFRAETHMLQFKHWCFFFFLKKIEKNFVLYVCED